MERHRIDNWLKHVCLFRHRAEATEACRGGKVRINGVRAKPAAKVKEGDLIEFFNGTLYRRVIVGSVPEKQVSREMARTAYIDETPTQEAAPAAPVVRERGAGRPTKRERRELEKLRR